jgi:hypothetical protein
LRERGGGGSSGCERATDMWRNALIAHPKEGKGLMRLLFFMSQTLQHPKFHKDTRNSVFSRDRKSSKEEKGLATLVFYASNFVTF